jgi:ubiquinol-cytochrome c reductase cytochrome c subunit
MRGLGRRWLRRRARIPAAVRLVLATVSAAAGLSLLVATQAPANLDLATGGAAAPGGAPRVLPDKAPIAPAPGELTAPLPSSPALVSEGRGLYAEGCSSCHGIGLQGRAGVAPSLIGVGAGPVDFYLSTGRMPLQEPRDQPLRAPAHYTRTQIDALVAFVASFGGPPAPEADPAKGSLDLGRAEFTLDCAGCHQVVARGGLTLGAQVPSLLQANARQVAEAVRMGPYLMPHFDTRQIDQHTLDSIARYVLWTQHPADSGGWGIYNLGPIPEGMVAWFLLLLSLVLFARLIGERTT